MRTDKRHSQEEEFVQYSEYEDPHVPEEMKEYVERFEAEPDSLPEIPVNEDGEALVTALDHYHMPANAVVLPVTQPEFELGIQTSVNNKMRWMAEWSMYMIKKYGDRVFFKR